MLLQILLKLHKHQGDHMGEKSSCERFCKVPSAENYCWIKIGNGVISLLWQLQCHCNLDHDKFSSCLFMGTYFMLKLGIDPEKLYRATFICQYGLCCCNMALVSFLLFHKILGILREFFWAKGLPPPLAKNFPYTYGCYIAFA